MALNKGRKEESKGKVLNICAQHFIFHLLLTHYDILQINNLRLREFKLSAQADLASKDLGLSQNLAQSKRQPDF